MRTIPRHGATALALVFTLALCGCQGSGHSNHLGTETVNTQLAIGDNYRTGMVSLGNLMFLLVNENEQGGRDLNGDGDIADDVVHMVDTTNGQVTNLGVSGTNEFAASETSVAWILAEEDEGSRDFNQDGDTADLVLATFNPEQEVSALNPRISGLQVSAASPLKSDGVSFGWFRNETLDVDINADGDQSDYFLQCYDPNDGSWVSAQSAMSTVSSHFVFRHGMIAFLASELDSGPDGTDFNGDGDASDTVLYVLDTETGELVPVGAGGFPRSVTAGSFNIGGRRANPIIAYAIEESTEGAGGTNFNQDGLNFDADTSDDVLALFEMGTRTESFPGGGLAIQSTRIRANTTRVCVSAPEADNGLYAADFNSDYDGNDVVPFWIDLEGDSSRVYNAGYAQDAEETSPFPQICGQYLIFLVDETAQGRDGTNFNQLYGDEDVTDYVPFFLDVRTPNTQPVNLGIAADQVICSTDGFVMAVAKEGDSGEYDFNQDGDALDEVLTYYRIVDGVADSTPHFVGGPGGGNSVVVDCPSHVFIVTFVKEGSDYDIGDRNRDGDLDDYIVTSKSLDKETGKGRGESVSGTVDPLLGERGFAFIVGENSVAFPTLESSLGSGQNLNGDDDAFDHVLQYLTFDCF